MLIDLHAHGSRFCGGWAHAGFVRAALWLLHEIQGPLCELHAKVRGEMRRPREGEAVRGRGAHLIRELRAQGVELLLVGHSLGGGVASLLSVLLRPSFPRLRCFGFATPAVAAGEHLLALLDTCVTSVVLRNDAIPRATFRSARSARPASSHTPLGAARREVR